MDKEYSFRHLSLLFLICSTLTATVQGQTPQKADTSDDFPANNTRLKTLQIEPGHSINLDGDLNEEVWQQASVATGFTQREPDDGAPATEKTEARVVHANDAIYVGARVYDSAMDSVAATLFRKDGSAYSDWFYVSIDSYNDNRTSLSFAVNPRGVRKDILTYNNDNEDIQWDAVWEAATSIGEESWIVEIKIPLSQLRFDGDRENSTWGINFQRRLARKEEISFWSPTPQDASGFVSRYGTLKGIDSLSSPNHLEITPYASGRLTREPGVAADPYYQENSWDGSVGADFKYGISSDFTLTGTINPDFGQVEADPATINLSAYETYFNEQRPFFMEGTDIFQFGRTETYNTFGNPMVFYSRRIGRAPQGQVSNAGIDAGYVDAPNQSTIAGAAKVSGKTDKGFSVGLLNAFTLREKAQYQTTAGEEGSISVEPATNYFVGRAKQDFSEGRTTVGGYASAVNRSIQEEYLSASLHQSAYIAGADFEHSWNDREWIVSGVFSGSSVSGSTEAIGQTQRSSARYYNRVDADYLSVDPGKTSLSGYAGELSVGRFGGKHWRGSLTYSTVSPGYGVNDLGFENRADYHATSYLVQYRESDPAKPFRSYDAFLYANHAFNFGGDMINNGYGFITNLNFTNLWSLNINAGYNGESYDDRLLRGGPLALTPTGNYYSAVVSSDQSHHVAFSLGHLREQNSVGDITRDAFLDLQIRPTPYIQLNIIPNFNFQKDTDQYVLATESPQASDTYGTRYVLADTDRTTLSTEFRLDWTFTPEMSVQTYVRPFIATGDFYNYKEFTTPKDFEFAVYGEDLGTIQQDESTYTVDPDGAGSAIPFSFQDRDFNFKSIQTNAVFRWEYKPGSTFYLVWQQERSGSTLHDNLRFSRDVNRLFYPKPTNIFLMKYSYWFGT